MHDDPGRVHRVKAKPLRGRFASPDTAATAKGDGSYEEDGEDQDATTPRRSRAARVAVSVAVHRCTGGFTRDRPRTLVQVEPIWTMLMHRQPTATDAGRQPQNWSGGHPGLRITSVPPRCPRTAINSQ